MDMNVCRICLKKGTLGKFNRMVDIFGKENFVKQIRECTGVEIQCDDSMLPQKMCGKCFLLLRHAVEFRTKCRTSNEHLQSLREKLITNNVDATKTYGTAEASPTIDNISNPLQIDLSEQKDAAPKILNFTQVILQNDATSSNVLESNDIKSDQLIDTDIIQVGMKEEFTFKQENIELKKDKTRNNAKNYICDQCGNHFTCRHHFVTHLRRHAGDKQFQCELCPDKFFTHSELNRHMRKHTGEKPFECKYCARRFTDYSTRIKHERTHTNERPFGCSHCDKAFTSSYILKNHLLIHTGERPFECTTCDKTFQRQSHLVVHYRSLLHKKNELNRKLNLK